MLLRKGLESQTLAETKVKEVKRWKQQLIYSEQSDEDRYCFNDERDSA